MEGKDIDKPQMTNKAKGGIYERSIDKAKGEGWKDLVTINHRS
jgi:hypothetical protein